MRLFALLVGITEWKDPDWPEVIGAAEDVANTRKYLEQDLHTPSSNIHVLEGPNATRDGILAQFRHHLINNRAIQDGDPILFYYAGHGDITDAPPHWPVISDDRKIESIVPYDYGTADRGGQYICGIPDRTIAALLEQLAERHGDNITVILDCCHSGHGTRKGVDQSPSFQIRAVDPAKAIPLRDNIDQEIWSSIPPSKQRRLWGVFTKRRDKSHILITACGPREQVIGNEEGGIFTKALLTCLRRKDIYPRSYAELVKHAERTLHADWMTLYPNYSLPNQHPQCEGVSRDRLVFEKTQVRPNMLTATWQPDRALFRIECSCSLLGIRPGTRFELYNLDPQYNIERVIGIATATEVGNTYLLATVAESTSVKGQLHKACLLDHPYILSFAVDDSVHRLPARVRAELSNLPPTLTRVDSMPERADILLQIQEQADGGVFLFLHRQDVHLRDLTTPVPRFDSSELETLNIIYLLESIAHFNYYLDKANVTHPYAEDVHMEMWLLDQGIAVPRPLKTEINFKNDEAIILATDNNEYVFVLQNNGQIPLYPYIMYFDTSTYEISIWWSPADDNAPLLPGGRLQIGASPEHQPTFDPFVPDGQRTDTSIIKIILMQTPTTLDLVAQGAQVGPDRITRTTRGGAEKSIVASLAKDGWDSITRKITVYI